MSERMRSQTRTLLLLCLSFTTGCLAYARLGETLTGLEALYGKPIGKAPATLTVRGKTVCFGDTFQYVKNDTKISATVAEGHCTQISYARDGDWTENQFDRLLDENSQAFDWEALSNKRQHAYIRKWKRSDGAEAVWTLALSSLTLTAPAHKDAQTKAASGSDSASKSD
jgi:hypothetical protein